MSPEEAAETIAALGEVAWWIFLVDRYGWTLEQTRAWAAMSLKRLVLAER